MLEGISKLIKMVLRGGEEEMIEVREKPKIKVEPIDYGERLYQMVLKARFPLLYHAVLSALKTWAKDEIRPYDLHSRVQNALCDLTGQKDWKVSYKAIGLVLTRLGVVRERVRQGKRGKLAVYRIRQDEVNQYMEAIKRGIEGRLGCVLPSYKQYQNWMREAERREKIMRTTYGEYRREEAEKEYELLKQRLRDYFGIEIWRARF